MKSKIQIVSILTDYLSKYRYFPVHNVHIYMAGKKTRDGETASDTPFNDQDLLILGHGHVKEIHRIIWGLVNNPCLNRRWNQHIRYDIPGFLEVFF